MAAVIHKRTTKRKTDKNPAEKKQQTQRRRTNEWTAKKNRRRQQQADFLEKFLFVWRAIVSPLSWPKRASDNKCEWENNLYGLCEWVRVYVCLYRVYSHNWIGKSDKWIGKQKTCSIYIQNKQGEQTNKMISQSVLLVSCVLFLFSHSLYLSFRRLYVCCSFVFVR